MEHQVDLITKLEAYYDTSIPGILLSFMTVILNIFVINYYRKSELTTVPLLYTSIAIADILCAIGVTHQAIAMSLFVKEVISEDTLSFNSMIFYSLIQISYRCSVFYNLLLAVTRTIMILRPFHRIKIRMVKAALILYVLPWGVLLVINIYQLHFANDEFSFVFLIYYHLIYMASGIATFFVTDPRTEKVRYFTITTIPDVISFVIPAMLITICCLIQIISLHRSSQFPASSNQRHVTITVILMSILFVLCNSAFLLYMTVMSILFITDDPYVRTLRKDFTVYIAVLGTVLPILNAALNPVIIISRSRGLKVRFVNTIRVRTQAQRAAAT